MLSGGRFCVVVPERVVVPDASARPSSLSLAAAGEDEDDSSEDRESDALGTTILAR